MKKRRGIVTALAAGLMTALLSVPAMAATAYTPVKGTSCTFKKYLIMDAGDSVPGATFSFTVAPGQAIPYDLTTTPKKMQVLAGVGTPTVANVTFASTEDTFTAYENGDIDVQRDQEARTGTADTDLVQFDTGEKYAKKAATIDFSTVEFDEPGIYRYIITETASTEHAAAGIVHDSDTDRVLDVYVLDDGVDPTDPAKIKLRVAGYVMHTDVGNVAMGADNGSADVTNDGDPLTDKTDGFTNEYSAKDLVFKKEVDGNQASRDKYFEFTVKLGNVAAGDTFSVSLADDSNAATTDGKADATSGTNSATIAANQGKANATSVTGSQLMTGVKFYLQHGQSIAIRGIAPNATYEITENAEDYKSEAAAVTDYTAPVKADSTTTQKTIGEVAGSEKVVKTSFKNTREGIIPTGILLSAAPWIILGVVVLGGVIFFLVRSRKKYDEE